MLDGALVVLVEEAADLDGIVGQHPEPAPSLGAVEAVDQVGPIRRVFEVEDPPF